MQERNWMTSLRTVTALISEQTLHQLPQMQDVMMRVFINKLSSVDVMSIFNFYLPEGFVLQIAYIFKNLIQSFFLFLLLLLTDD